MATSYCPEALMLMGLKDTPPIRFKDVIPDSKGFDPARHKQTVAYYHYRKMMGLPLNESIHGEAPYLPKWTEPKNLKTFSVTLLPSMWKWRGTMRIQTTWRTQTMKMTIKNVSYDHLMSDPTQHA